MNLGLIPVALIGISALYAAGSALRRRIQARHLALPRRTPADVLRDVDIARGCRRLQQAIQDYDDCWAIYPDPRSWRAIELQHRLDTAKQRKENEQP